MGRARVEGMASTVCDYLPDVVSQDASLLGVRAKYMYFNGIQNVAGSNMFGAGTRNATIQYDVLTPPPTKKLSGLAPARVPGLVR
jgi:hypothetical protein